MYLAEDRILSLGIYCQIKSKYTLHYVPNAEACTDPMKTHQDPWTIISWVLPAARCKTHRYSLTHNRNIMNHDELKAESDFISQSLARPQDQSPQHWQSSYFRSEYLSLCQKIPNVDENFLTIMKRFTCWLARVLRLLSGACKEPSAPWILMPGWKCPF